MNEHRRYAEKFLKSFLLKECQEQRKELIEKFLEFLEFKSASLEGFDSLVVFMKKDFEEEKEKWEVKLKDISS